MKANNAIIATLLVAVLAVTAASCIVPASEGETDQGFVITDSTGKQSVYDGPSDQIMVFGYAATLTLLDAGAASKIYATDQYGEQAFVEKGIAVPKVFKTSYSDATQLKSNIIGSVDDGFDKENGTIVLTTFATIFVGADKNSGLRGDLLDIGFSHVLFYGSVYEYDDVVKIVKDLELISGSDIDLASGMIATKERVQNAVAGLEKTKAAFLRYSASKGWTIGTTGTIGGSLITAAGGDNLGLQFPTNVDNNNKDSIVALLEKNDGAVLFMDYAYFDTYGGTFEQFVDDFFHGNLRNLKLVKMENTWNNYDPESAEGLVEIAHVLHPDAVEGTVEPYAEPSPDSGERGPFFYVGIVVGILIVLAIAYALLRIRRHI